MYPYIHSSTTYNSQGMETTADAAEMRYPDFNKSVERIPLIFWCH